MIQALLSGVAAIQAQQTRMNVIGDNLANIDTTAYKSSDVSFQDMIAQTIQGASAPTTALGGKNPIQYGLGVLVAGTNVNNQQGSLNATNSPSDLGISGNGFFMVANGSNVSYTRDGGLTLDTNGNLVQNSTGQRLLGWEADATGKINTSAPITGSSLLSIPIGGLSAAQATTKVGLTGNLSASAASTDTWTTQTTVYDQQGGAHTITIEFSNPTNPPAAGAPSNATSSWNWSAFEGSTTSGTPLGSSSGTGNSPLYFDTSGNLINSTALGNITVTPTTGTGTVPIGLDFSKITQLNSTTQVAVSSQNGFPPGTLQSYAIDGNGVITGTFSNGLSRALGQVAMAGFANPSGLSRIGNNLWAPSNNSGSPVVGTANASGLGSINAGYLEQSNVDISSQFTDMIVTQRGFEANTKVVTTVDQMLQDLLQMVH